MLQPGAPGPSQHPTPFRGLHPRNQEQISSPADKGSQTFWASKRGASMSLAKDGQREPRWRSLGWCPAPVEDAQFRRQWSLLRSVLIPVKVPPETLSSAQRSWPRQGPRAHRAPAVCSGDKGHRDLLGGGFTGDTTLCLESLWLGQSAVCHHHRTGRCPQRTLWGISGQLTSGQFLGCLCSPCHRTAQQPPAAVSLCLLTAYPLPFQSFPLSEMGIAW